MTIEHMNPTPNQGFGWKVETVFYVPSNTAEGLHVLRCRGDFFHKPTEAEVEAEYAKHRERIAKDFPN